MPKTDTSSMEGKKGRWVTVMGRKRFISDDPMKKPSKHGLATQLPSTTPEEADAKKSIFNEIYVEKASYNNSSQDSTPKRDPEHIDDEEEDKRGDTEDGQQSNTEEREDGNEEPKSTENREDNTEGDKGIPIYVATTHDPMDEDRDREGTDAKIGETVKYDLGRREGKLIKVDGLFALILRSDGKYDTVEAQTVYRVTDYTRYGLWKDIPTDFRVAMLRKVHVAAEYANKKWVELPRQLKEVLVMKADGSDTFSRAYDQHRDPSGTNDFEGVKDAKEPKTGARSGDVNSQEDGHKDEPNWQSAFENKTGEKRNPNNHEGISSNIKDPQEDHRRDGRLTPDNEETNNTVRDDVESDVDGGERLNEHIDNEDESEEKMGDTKPSKVGKDTGTAMTTTEGYDNPVYGEDAGFPKKKPTVQKSYGITYGVTELKKSER